MIMKRVFLAAIVGVPTVTLTYRFFTEGSVPWYMWIFWFMACLFGYLALQAEERSDRLRELR